MTLEVPKALLSVKQPPSGSLWLLCDPSSSADPPTTGQMETLWQRASAGGATDHTSWEPGSLSLISLGSLSGHIHHLGSQRESMREQPASFRLY